MIVHGNLLPKKKTFSENILSAPLPLDDLFVYNLDTDTWEEEIFMGSFPFARMGTTLVSIPNRNPPKTKGKSKSKGKKGQNEPKLARSGYLLLFGGAGPVIR